MRRTELSYAAGVLCLGVCLIHVLSAGITGLDVQSWQYAVVYWPWRLCSCAVPTFLVLGGIKVGLRPPRSYPDYLKRRVRRVVLPYLLAFAVYYLAYWAMGYLTPSLWGAAKKLVMGTGSFHFYYIIITVQFYLLLPLWRWLLDRLPPWAALTGALLIMIFWRGVPTLLRKVGVSFTRNDRVFLTYLAFWVAGLFIGKHYEAFLEGLRKRATLWWTGLLALLITGLSYCAQRWNFAVPNIGDIQVMADFCSCFWLLGIMLRVAEQGPKGLQTILAWLGAGSYQIYLWHAIFLTVLIYFRPSVSMAPLLILRALVTFGGGLGVWTLVWLISRRRKA